MNCQGCKISPWLLLIIGVLFLLPLIGVSTGSWGEWLIAIAFILLGIFQIMASKACKTPMKGK